MNRTELTRAAAALLRQEKAGVLSTHSTRMAGYPFGSLMPYPLDEANRPLFLISSLAVHTKNLSGDGRCSLAIVEPPGADPAAVAGRLTLLGDAVAIRDESAALERVYLERHPEAARWIGFGDFAIWRLETKSVYYVAGFGAMGWLDPAALAG
jgi:hypothetical protein